MSLEEIRRAIDRLDSKILMLLNERMELGLMARRFKSQVQDEGREKELLDRMRSSTTRLIQSGFIEGVYAEIIKESKRLQKQDHGLIAFQGEHGAYGEVASMGWNSDLIPIPSPEFPGVFEGVKSGLYDYGIVPVENSLGGSVGPVNHLLINTELYAVGAVELQIHHCLLALPGSDHREIRSVFSHPQALSQCRLFLSRNRLEPVSYYDTAGAAKMLAEDKPKAAAVIASKLAAELYHLEIIKEDIQDLQRNVTRFLVLSGEEHDQGGDKCSIIFSTEHKAGTLFKVLNVFAERDINLTRIESIPNEPGNYAFFLDFMGSKKDERVVVALEETKKMTTHFRLLGCYQEMEIS